MRVDQAGIVLRFSPNILRISGSPFKSSDVVYSRIVVEWRKIPSVESYIQIFNMVRSQSLPEETPLCCDISSTLLQWLHNINCINSFDLGEASPGKSSR